MTDSTYPQAWMHYRPWRGVMPPGNPDSLFREDGTVKLPKLIGLAVRMAETSHGCLSRQPTEERAEAVAAAIRERYPDLAIEIRPGRKTPTFGVYIPVKAAH